MKNLLLLAIIAMLTNYSFGQGRGQRGGQGSYGQERRGGGQYSGGERRHKRGNCNKERGGQDGEQRSERRPPRRGGEGSQMNAGHYDQQDYRPPRYEYDDRNNI